MTGTQTAPSHTARGILAIVVILLFGSCANIKKMKMPPSGFEDTILEGRIKELYWTDSILANSDILVIAKGGAIDLSGIVATEEMKARAETVARKVAGVKSIVNRIELQQ